jgi:O-antigen/teichoic acid export membrane protein
MLMGFITTPSTLGIYAVAVNVSEPLLYLPAAVSSALIPLIAGSPAASRLALTLRAFRFVLVATIGSILVAALVGPPVLPLLFGPAFNASVGPYLWLLPGAIGYVLSRVFSSALMGASRPGLSSVGSVTALLVGIALDVALIPSLGATGAAIAATAAFAAGGVAAVLAFRLYTPFAWRLLLSRTGSD